MSTKHYYAMYTPDGNAVNSTGTPIGTVEIFATKRERDTWVANHSYNTRTGNAHQTKAITEHEARVTMLRQRGREMCAYQKKHGITYTYREYAQYHPTALMVRDYNAVAYVATTNQQ
jgi:hypothetical protein